MKRHEFSDVVLAAGLPATTNALLWALCFRDKATLSGSYPSQERLARACRIYGTHIQCTHEHVG